MSPKPARFDRHQRAGFAAGLGAGALLTLVMLVLSRVFGLFSLPELLSYRIIALLPFSVFELGVQTLRGNAKELLLVVVTLGQIVVGGLLGVLWASMAATLPGESRPGRRIPAFWQPGPSGGLLLAVFLFVLVDCALFPLLGAGFLGAHLNRGPAVTAVVLAAEVAGYGLVLAALYRARMGVVRPAEDVAAARIGRRLLLRRLALGAAALAVGGATFGLLNRRGGSVGADRPGGGRVGNGGLPPEVTPNEAFYQVSKNFTDPKVLEAGWNVIIGGMVERPYSLTLAEIRALPAVTDYRTLCCISNEIGGDLISNAGWKGVRLKDLLERAGVQAGAVDLKITAKDGYVESFPIDKALTPDVLAVYEMNGQPLPDAHGFPLRLLVPNIYGMKNVKWVWRLDVVGSDIQGFWQQQGWSDVATIQTMSRFDFPRARQLLAAGRNRVGGVAFAGARGIKKVEATPDGGRTWQEAQLRRPLGPYTWVLWTAELDLAEGDHKLMVRATDGTGETQTDQETDTLPDGATGWHTISVRAATGIQVTPEGRAPAAPTGSAPILPFRGQYEP